MKCLLDECQNEAKIKFCSLSCGAKYQHRVNPVIPKTRECKRNDCGVVFLLEKGTYGKIFCSRSCSAKVSNSNRKSKAKFCVRCKSAISGKGYKYCSQFCAFSYNKEDKIQKWLAGEWSGGTNNCGLSVTVRNYLLEQSGYRCSSPACDVPGGFCTPHPSDGVVPLNIDHIDGDAYNNSPDNLRVLCLNCHGLTPNYGARNRNGTRKYRQKYY